MSKSDSVSSIRSFAYQLLLISAFLAILSPTFLFADDSMRNVYASLSLPVLPEDISDIDKIADQPDPETGLYLVATRNLQGSVFEKTVILLIDHGPHGSIGLIINRDAGTRLSTAFPHIKEFEGSKEVIYSGGPVNTMEIYILVRSDVPPPDSRLIGKNIYAVSGLSSLKMLVRTRGGKNELRIYSGYAGWWPGQLDRELMRGSWNAIKGDLRIIFENDHSGVWNKLIRK